MKLDIKDYIDKKINNLTVVGKDTSNEHPNFNKWIFRCDCGKEFSSVPSRVISGHTKSCGCKKGKAALTHGCNGDEFYPTWWGMMRRCYHKENQNYERYGGRGITVCDEWHDPRAFIKWARETAGSKTPKLTLDRIDNDAPYSPENCRWATPRDQSNNRRCTRLVEFNGKKIPITVLAEEYGLDPDLVRARIFVLGWEVEDAITTPAFETMKNPHKSKNKKRGNTKKSVEIDGVTKTITQWCEQYGTSRNAAYKRILRGWDAETAVKTPNKR